MDHGEVEDDSIDLEALQAQIDMSMSFAQEMVSSWVKPSKKMPNRANRDIEAELKEYMHRPPRLGVGAVISEPHSASRDIARLRGHLTEKKSKRPREEPSTITEPDDAEESRASVIQKKARPNPFGDAGKKKNKPAAEGRKTGLPSARITTENHDTAGSLVDSSTLDSPPVATKRRKKRHTNRSHLDNSRLKAESRPSEPSSVVPGGTADGFLVTSEQIPANLLETSNSVDPTTPASPLQRRRLAQSTALLQQPLLNLVPTGTNDEPKNDAVAGRDVQVISPRKKRKRKRRKKKKSDDINAILEVSSAP